LVVVLKFPERDEARRQVGSDDVEGHVTDPETMRMKAASSLVP
jgi:hypothetical protein